MAEKITDQTMEELEILAKLQLSETERKQSKKEIQRMLDYVELLNRLDTDGVEPLIHLFPVENGFREDEPEESSSREELLKGAPQKKDGQFVVPRTIG